MKKTKAFFGKLSIHPRSRNVKSQNPSPASAQHPPSPPFAPSSSATNPPVTNETTVVERQRVELPLTSSSSTPQAIDEMPGRSVDRNNEILPASEQQHAFAPSKSATFSSPEHIPNSGQLEPHHLQAPPSSPMKVTSSEKCETRSALELQKALDKF